MVSIAMMTKIVSEKVAKSIDKIVKIGYMQGFITDGHVYEENFEEVQKIIKKYDGNNQH